MGIQDLLYVTITHSLLCVILDNLNLNQNLRSFNFSKNSGKKLKKVQVKNLNHKVKIQIYALGDNSSSLSKRQKLKAVELRKVYLTDDL